MNKFKTIVVDDEKNCVEVLEILLKQDHPDIELVQTFTNSLNALEYIQNNSVDLIFLDIQMPHLTGIELIQKIENPSFHVIFTTAFDHYAIEAIKVSALDYLLKPIDEELLEESLKKFRKVRGANIQGQLQQLISQMQQNSNPASNNQEEKIAVSFQDKISFYKSEEIIYCQSNDNYTTLFLTSGDKVTASKTMKHFEEILEPLGFIRSHQSYLVNTTHIKEYSKKDGGYIVLNDDTNIPVSRQRKEDILQLFKKV